MNKFKKGDKVICITNDADVGHPGSGWEVDMSFTIRNYSHRIRRGKDSFVYWGESGYVRNNGVFEEYLMICSIVPDELFKI